MDRIRDEAIEQLFTASGRDVLRVVFRDGEVYDLTSFHVAQDDDEEHPHATATVVRAVRHPEEKARFFTSGRAMFFSLDEVGAVLDPRSGAVLFDFDDR